MLHPSCTLRNDLVLSSDENAAIVSFEISLYSAALIGSRSEEPFIDGRGCSRNIPISEVLEQARRIAGAGIKEIVITGVNTGDFGRTTGESFLDLLKRLNDVEGIERYRISSIEPNLITEDIVDWIASGTKFQPHFHIPLQSGSDTILKRVGRRYTTHTAFVERNRGRRSQVLWESDERDGMMGGYTGNYIRVERPYDPVLVNMVEDITI